jgi:hypothetical protein
MSRYGMSCYWYELFLPESSLLRPNSRELLLMSRYWVEPEKLFAQLCHETQFLFKILVPTAKVEWLIAGANSPWFKSGTPCAPYIPYICMQISEYSYKYITWAGSEPKTRPRPHPKSLCFTHSNLGRLQGPAQGPLPPQRNWGSREALKGYKYAACIVVFVEEMDKLHISQMGLIHKIIFT